MDEYLKAFIAAAKAANLTRIFVAEDHSTPQKIEIGEYLEFPPNSLLGERVSLQANSFKANMPWLSINYILLTQEVIDVLKADGLEINWY